MGGGPSFLQDAKPWGIPGRKHGMQCYLLTPTLTQPLGALSWTLGEGRGKMDAAPASRWLQTAYKLWRKCQA